MESSILRSHSEARLPRYTSYPTAPLFSPAVDGATYAEWLAGLSPDQPISLYLHIPFCRSMCWYCGCHTTITAKDQPITRYLALLRREIEMIATQTRSRLPVKAVHFGGGTPTIMTAKDFIGLMQLLRDCFDVTRTAELAIEIDPRTLSPGMAEALARAGINRASLGVQSFDPVVQRAINRIQSADRTAEVVANLRRSGVKGINFDLIYGLPHQTVHSCTETVATALTMRPDRLAVFGYAHVPGFKKHQRLIEEAALPDGMARTEQALAIAEMLVAAGYRQIGLDHFALPDDELARAQSAGRLRRNFQGYTTDDCETLVGFGASAIGRMPEGYVQNAVNLGDYSDSIDAGRPATAKGYRLTDEDRLRAAVIERLMCDFEADIPAICARHGFDPITLIDGNERLACLVEQGLVHVTGGIVRVQSDYRFLVRAAAAAFDAYLERSPRVHSRAA